MTSREPNEPRIGTLHPLGAYSSSLTFHWTSQQRDRIEVCWASWPTKNSRRCTTPSMKTQSWARSRLMKFQRNERPTLKMCFQFALKSLRLKKLYASNYETLTHPKFLNSATSRLVNKDQGPQWASNEARNKTWSGGLNLFPSEIDLKAKSLFSHSRPSQQVNKMKGTWPLTFNFQTKQLLSLSRKKSASILIILAFTKPNFKVPKTLHDFTPPIRS